MSTLGWIHTVFALAALASGAAVLLRPKGTFSHRRTGWVYAGSMLGLNGTALLIYRLFGGFGPFHVAAVASLATLVCGMVPAVRRRPAEKWVEHHYYWMAYSYLGLLAAAVSEVATRVPGTVFWWAVVIPTVALFVAGSRLIKRRADRTLAPFRRSSIPIPETAPVPISISLEAEAGERVG